MNDDTLVVVHCFAGDRDRVVEFLPFYLHHECPVLVLSPEDAPVQIDHPDVTCRSAGLAGWKGWHTLERQIAHLQIVAEFPQTYLLLNDSDSMCLTPELPSYLYGHPEDTFFSNEAMWQEPGAPLVPPYFFTQAALARMLEVKDEALKMKTTRGAVAWSDPYNDSPAIDALYIELVRFAGLMFRAFPDGVHRETAHPHDLQLLIGEMLERGARFIHSVKTRETLDIILAFHRQRERLLEEEGAACTSS